jgi:hypothetical protein
MRGYGYYPGPGWDWFPDSHGPERELADARKARENAPTKVLSEMAVVFGTSLAVVLLIDAGVFLASVAM